MKRIVGLRPSAWRFAVTGGIVAVAYFAVTSALVGLAGVPAQLAIALGYAATLTLHFTLNRRFVFVSQRGYAMRLSSQGARYVVVALCSYALTAVVVAAAGRANVPELAAGLLTPLVLAGISFVVLRTWVFASAPAALADES